MSVLLCLLSDQHVPNLLSVHHYRPEALVLVESTAMQKKHAAKNFRQALALGGLNFDGDACVVEPLEMEDELESVRLTLKRAYGRFPTEPWIANLSGGTKPMSIAAYEFFKAVGARLVYVNFSRPDEILGLDGRPTEKCSYHPTVREFLAGYGFDSTKKAEDVATAEERASEWWECAMLIARDPPDEGLLRIGDLSDPTVKRRWDDARKKGLQLAGGQLVPSGDELRARIAGAFSLTVSDEGLLGSLDKYAVEFLTGGWLEVFVWGLLTRHAQALGVWDVRLGFRPSKIGVSIDSDFDVCFMHGYRLCMVECKSGSQANDPGAEVLHKVEAVVRQFRALGIRSCLATTSSNVLGKDGALKPGIQDRAGIYQCGIVVRDQIRSLAQSPDDLAIVRAYFLENRPG